VPPNYQMQPSAKGDACHSGPKTASHEARKRGKDTRFMRIEDRLGPSSGANASGVAQAGMRRTA